MKMVLVGLGPGPAEKRKESVRGCLQEGQAHEEEEEVEEREEEEVGVVMSLSPPLLVGSLEKREVSLSFDLPIFVFLVWLFVWLFRWREGEGRWGFKIL